MPGIRVKLLNKSEYVGIVFSSYPAVIHTSIISSYAALGLVHSLNPSASGGSEHAVSPENHPLASMDQAMKGPPLTFGRIVRSEAGEIVRVEMNEDHINTSTRQRTPSIDTDTLSKWTASRGARESLGFEGAIVKGECVLSYF